MKAAPSSRGLLDKYKYFSPSRRMDLSFIILNLLSFVQSFCMQFLPSSMRGLEKDLNFSPKQLSGLVLVEQTAAMSLIPVWGFLTDRFEIKHVLIPTMYISGLMMTIQGFFSNAFMMFAIRLVVGGMSGALILASQKFVQLAKMKNAGYAFAIIHIYYSLGRLFSSLTVTPFASNTYSGIYGWRVCSFVIGAAFFLVGSTAFYIPLIKPDSQKPFNSGRRFDLKKLWEYTKSIFLKVREIFSVTSIVLLTLVLFLGQGSYIAAFFVTLYFQYCRLSNLKAGITYGAVVVSGLLGAAAFGKLSDFIHSKFPASSAVGLHAVRLLAALFGLFPLHFDNIAEYYVVFLFLVIVFGLTFASLSFIDRPIALDLIMPNDQSFGCGLVGGAYSQILFLSCGIGSLIFSKLLGLLINDTFGYQETSLDMAEMPVSLMRNNAFALRNAIAVMIVFSTVSALVVYGLMTLTYHKDCCKIKEKVKRMDMRTESISTIV